MNKGTYQEISSKEWLAQGTESNHFLISVPGFASVKTLWERFGFGYDYILSYIKNDFCYWHYYVEDLKKVTEYILWREEKSPGTVDSLIKEWRADEKRLNKAGKKAEQLDLKSLSDQELISEFKQYLEAALGEWGLSIMCDGFSLYSENLILPLLKPLVEKHHQKISYVLPLLTAPVDQSFAMEESISFLKLLKQAKENKRIKTLLEEGDFAELSKFKSFYHDLKEHTKNFFWLKNSYLQTFKLDEEFFAKRLAIHVKEEKDLAREIKKLTEGPLKTKKEKEALGKELGCDRQLLGLLKLVEKFAWWQDVRKKYCLISNHYLMLFLEEACRRRNYRKEDIFGITAEEYEGLVKGEINLEETKRRSKHSMIIYRRSGTEVLMGEEGEKLFQAIHKEINQEVNDIRGICASPGRVEGKVKIILASKDLSKMAPGDILVSSMTRPELVPAMKKAAAVVTDEGGLTCHAAIVSRELGIPCVVGTKIATKIFKNGEFVEVNANHGVIRRIK